MFTKLGMCIDIVDIWFGIANRQILSIFELSAHHTCIFLFSDDTMSKYQQIFTKRGMCIDIEDIWFGIGNGQITSAFDSYFPITHDGGVLSFHFFKYFCFYFSEKIRLDI